MTKPTPAQVVAAMEAQSPPPMGHNRSPFDDAVDAVETVYGEAQHWLDGATVVNQAEADAIAKLLDMARKARKVADDARIVAKKPHDDAAAAVQAQFKPLLSKCDLIADAAKKALTPWLQAQEVAKRETERVAREAAEAAQQAARHAFATATSLDDRAAAEEAAEAARRADIRARVAANDKSHAKGGARAVGLRTVRKGAVTDLRAFLRWVWETDRAALQGFADNYVAGAIRAGQPLPDSVTINDERVAV